MAARFLLLVIALYLPLSAMAQTSLYLEPYIGYHTNIEFKHPNSTDTASGFTYGGRLGIDYQNLLLALDYMSGAWTDDQSPKDNITPENLGIFIGYKFPMFKVYGDFFFDEKYKFSSSSGSGSYTGTEFKLGVAYTDLPVVNIGVEYGFGSLDKNNGSSMNSDIKVSYIGLVLSAPFEFEL